MNEEEDCLDRAFRARHQALRNALYHLARRGWSLQLVFDFGGRARAHETLQRRYYSLTADIQSRIVPTVQNCADWEAEMSRIAADEPPTLRALDAVADNQATAALLGSSRPRLKVTRFENMTRQILTHNASVFPPDPEWSPSDIELTRPDASPAQIETSRTS